MPAPLPPPATCRNSLPVIKVDWLLHFASVAHQKVPDFATRVVSSCESLMWTCGQTWEWGTNGFDASSTFPTGQFSRSTKEKIQFHHNLKEEHQFPISRCGLLINVCFRQTLLMLFWVATCRMHQIISVFVEVACLEDRNWETGEHGGGVKYVN